jgi:tight adherence protein C
MTIILLIAVTFLGVAAYFAADAATAPARQQELAVRRAARYGIARLRGPGAPRLRFRERVLTPGIHRLAAITLRVNPKASAESIGKRLLAAGVQSRISATQFLALKGGLALGGLVLMLLFAAVTTPVAGFLLAPLAVGFGFFSPDAFLTFKVRARREAIRAQLPDALDLLAVSVEAGLGFDGAVTKLTEHMEGPLVDEFALTLGEIRIGESRHEALKKFTERVPTPEVAAFVRSVIQADQLGISLGRILRVQGADSRLRRQAAAEEKAMKAPIKMLFPTVLFIFPAMFIVVLGPALMNLMHYFKQ